ncbi:MAG: hypothetical protein II978_01360 [Clostridia bacterium]|nr:hypothetical protein [Clostridia bacterium]
MNFNELRDYIVASGFLPEATDKEDSTAKYEAIFLNDKPEELDAEQFLVYTFKLRGGGIVKRYEVKLLVCSASVAAGIELRNKIVEYLNFDGRPCPIAHFVKFALNDEDGFSFDQNTGYYTNALSFECLYL